MARSSSEHLKKFVIDRKRWVRGAGDDAKMLTQTGKFCCLGFYAKACGVSSRFQTDNDMPDDVARCLMSESKQVPEEMSILLTGTKSSSSDLAYQLQSINDDVNISEHEREHLLVEKFAKSGVRVMFVN